MPRNRTLSPDFWTWEAVVDCAPMTRLLFIGLWTFADDHGVQPLRPRTIRMQVFPGDDLDAERLRAMIGRTAPRPRLLRRPPVLNKTIAKHGVRPSSRCCGEAGRAGRPARPSPTAGRRPGCTS